ncbi:hypothetical protein pb186bvf_012030 [Paramecium bursaria]
MYKSNSNLNPQRSLVPSVQSLNSQDEEYMEYTHLQRKLLNYRETLRVIAKSNEEDRKQLQSCRSSQYNTDILQLTESQDDDLQYINDQLQSTITEQEKIIQQLQDDLESYKKQLTQTLKNFNDVSMQRDILQNQLNMKNSRMNDVLLDITYENDESMVGGRRRTRSIKETQDPLCQRKLIEDLKDILQTDNLIKEIQSMKQQLHKQDKFISCLQDMIMKLTPKDIFKGKQSPNQETKPQLRDCWGWIKRVLNDYMAIKQQNQKEKKIISLLKDLLNVKEDDILREIQILLKMIG